MERRDFLRLSAGAAFGGVLFKESVTPKVYGAAKMNNAVGVQLYTIRNIMAEDFEGAIERVAEIGYDEVEFAGYFDRKPQQVRSLLDDLSLTAPAVHIPLDAVRGDLGELIETAGTIGHKYVIVPFLPESERTLEGYKRTAELFNMVGEEFQKADIQFGYHNHDFEFEETEGQIPFDLLLNETEPDLVTMELDIFWVARAGYEPLDYINNYPGRFKLCHVKDMDSEGTMVDVGSGTIDFAGIFSQSEQAGLEHYFVEHDNPQNPMDSILNSHGVLRELQA